MQKSYFAQLWKQNDNMTFLECVSRYRLREAERPAVVYSGQQRRNLQGLRVF